MNEGKEEETMNETLRNPHRRKLLEILTTKKVATPKEMADELKIGVTTVYYHLELMKGYVVKTQRGEYSLTEKGLALYRETLQSDMSKKTPVSRFMPYNIFVKQVSKPLIFLPLSIAIAALEYYLCQTYYFAPLLLGYTAFIGTSMLPVYYIGNIVVLFLIFEASSFILTRRFGGELALFNGIIASRLPLMLALLVPVFGQTSSTSWTIALAIGQLLCIALLSVYMSLAKGIKQEVPIIICLIVLYFNLLFYVVT
jgi:hypothetical protein